MHGRLLRVHRRRHIGVQILLLRLGTLELVVLLHLLLLHVLGRTLIEIGGISLHWILSHLLWIGLVELRMLTARSATSKEWNVLHLLLSSEVRQGLWYVSADLRGHAGTRNFVLWLAGHISEGSRGAR